MSTRTVMGGSQGPPGQGLQAVDVGKQQQSLPAKTAPVLLPQGTSCYDALAWTKLPPRVLLPFPPPAGAPTQTQDVPKPHQTHTASHPFSEELLGNITAPAAKLGHEEKDA